MSAKVIKNLEQQLLIAMPSVTDDMFKKTVIYVYEHDDKGAMAFIVNKPLPISIADILRQLNIEVTCPDANDVFLLQGGPVSKEQLYVVQHKLLEDDEKKSETKPTEQQGFALVQPQELLDAFAKGELLDISLPFLGYAGWGAGQLEKEIMNNDWLICPPSKKLLFDTPAEQRWEEAMRFLGIDPDHLVDNIGHA